MPPSDIPPTSRTDPDLLRKAELELALLAAPEDAAIHDAYLEAVLAFAAVRTGLVHVVLPGNFRDQRVVTLFPPAPAQIQHSHRAHGANHENQRDQPAQPAQQ